MNYKYVVSYYEGFKKRNRDLSAHSRKSNEKLFFKLASKLPETYAVCKERASRTVSALSYQAWGDFTMLKAALNQMVDIMEDLYGEDELDAEIYSVLFWQEGCVND